MPIKCSDFLSFAEDCLSNRNDEIGYRNSVARAYYSCYHKLEPLLKNAPKGHSKFINYLCNAQKSDSYDENFSAEDLRALGLLLDKEYPKRVTADYKLEYKVRKSDALKSIESARRFRDELDRLLQTC